MPSRRERTSVLFCRLHSADHWKLGWLELVPLLTLFDDRVVAELTMIGQLNAKLIPANFQDPGFTDLKQLGRLRQSRSCCLEVLSLPIVSIDEQCTVASVVVAQKENCVLTTQVLLDATKHPVCWQKAVATDGKSEVDS